MSQAHKLVHASISPPFGQRSASSLSSHWKCYWYIFPKWALLEQCDRAVKKSRAFKKGKMQNLRKENRAIGTNLSVGLARLDCSEPTTGAPRLNLSPTTPHAHQPRIILSLFYFGIFFVPLSLAIGPALAVALQGCCSGLNDMTPECGDTNFVKACWSFYSTPGQTALNTVKSA